MTRLATIAACIALTTIAVLGYAAWAKHADALELDAVARQLRGELSESERALVTADSELNKARSSIVSLRALNETNAVNLERMRHKLGTSDLEIHRQSTLIADLTGRVESATASAATPDGAYTARTSWYEFSTPNVFDPTVKTSLTLDLSATVTITGIRQRRGILESETAALTFADPDGVDVPITVAIRDYELRYAPEIDAEPWYRLVGVDAIARAHYLWPDEALRVQALGGVRLWRVTLEAGGELDSERNLNAVAGVSYRHPIF